MAEIISESGWKSFVKQQKLSAALDDKDLLKALARLDKTDERKPEPRLEALRDLAKEIPRQVAALAKRKKELGDKPFGLVKDELYAILEGAEALQKQTQAALDAEDDEDEDSKPNALINPKLLLKQLQMCRKDPDRTMKFAFIDAKDKQPAMLAMHPRMSARALFGKLQAAAGVKTGAYGSAWVEDMSLMLQLDKPLSGLAKKVRAPVRASGFRISRAVLWNEDGTVFEQDELPEDAVGEGQAQEEPGTLAEPGKDASLAPQQPSATIDPQIEAVEQELANLIQFLGSVPSPMANKGAQLLEIKFKDAAKETDGIKRLKLLQGLQAQGKQLLNADEISKAAAQNHQQQLDADEQERQRQAEATDALEQQVEALRQEISNLVQFLGETQATAAQRGAQLIAEKLSAHLKEADAAKCLKSLQVLLAQAKQFQNADEVSKGAKVERQAEIKAATDREQQISTIQLEIVKLVQALKATPSSVAKRGAQVIDTKLADYMRETDAAQRLKLLQTLKAQAKQFQNADEVSKTSADEQAIYDELAEFCMAWHGNTDVDRIADEAYLLFNNKAMDGNDPHLLPKLKALKEQAKASIVNVIYNRFLKSDPRNAKKIVDLKKKALATSNLAELHKHLTVVRERMTNQKKDGAKQADDALGKVNQEKLENLNAEQRIDLLSKLRLAIPDDESEQGGNQKALQPYFDAMAKLYKATPMLPEFANTQKTKRKDVLDALSSDPEVVKAHENWATWSQDEEGKNKKLEALKHILTVQSQLMGFKSVPEILPETMDKLVFEDENGGKFEQFDQGNFSSKDRAIRVNDHPESTLSTNFYKSLITMLHENTHNYQNELIDELKAGTLTEESNKEYYQQALLFLLNEDVGYLPPGDAYEEQPAERHAHEAEDEAAEAFEKFAETDVREGRKKCQELRGQIEKLIAQAQAEGLNDLEARLRDCQVAVQGAMRRDTSTEILAELAEAQRGMDLLKPTMEELQIKMLRDEAESLMLGMRANTHPKLVAAIEGWCTNLANTINKQGQKLAIIERDLGEFRGAVGCVPAAAKLIAEMEQWIQDHTDYKDSVDIYCDALRPKQVRLLPSVLERTRVQFEDKRKEAEANSV